MSTMLLVLRFGYGHTSPELMVVLGVLALIVFAYRAFFSERAVIKRKLKKAPTRKIKDVKSGEVVKVIGKVVFAGVTVKAALSNRECAYYHVEVEEYVKSGRSGQWRKIIDEKKRGDIVLQDATGYAIIQDDEAQTVLFRDVVYTSGLFDDPLPEMEAFLKKHDSKSTNWAGFNKSMQYHEGALEEGELCAVSGKAIWMPVSKLSINLPVNKVLVIRRAPQVQCAISDHPEVINEPLLS